MKPRGHQLSVAFHPLLLTNTIHPTSQGLRWYPVTLKSLILGLFVDGERREQFKQRMLLMRRQRFSGMVRSVISLADLRYSLLLIPSSGNHKILTLFGDSELNNAARVMTSNISEGLEPVRGDMQWIIIWHTKFFGKSLIGHPARFTTVNAR